MRNEHVALLGLTLCTLFLAQSEPALAQVVFTKAETVATGVLTSFRGCRVDVNSESQQSCKIKAWPLTLIVSA